MFPNPNRVLAGIAALAALALGGAAIADATTSTSTTTTTTPAHGAQSPPALGGPAHGMAAHEDAEKTVTGDSAAKAQAAAVKAVGGGTAGAVTTDYTGSGYEVTVTKADGTKVEVHLDGSFNVMMGPGGHAGPPGGAPMGQAPPAA